MALLLGLALLPTGVLALHAGVTAVGLRYVAAQESVASKELEAMGDRAAELQRLRTVTRALAANADIASNSLRNCNALLGSLGAQFAEFDSVVILDARSRVRCAADPAVAGRAVRGEELIAAAARVNDVVLEFVPRPSLSAEPVFGAVAPVHGAPGLYAALSRRSKPLLARVDSQAAQPGGYAALVTGQGEILQVDGLEADSALSAAFARALTPGAIRDREPFRVGKSWAVATQVLDLDVYLVHGWRAAPNSLGNTLRIIWALAAPLLLWLAAVGVSWWAFESYVARPLSTLDRLARGYARGEDAATPAAFHAAPEEFLSLRRTLAAMAKTLRGREKRIAEALQEERALLREVNHRVKNNLQVVASIISILSRAADNDQQALGLARAQDRIQLLALAQNAIHSSGEVHDIQLDKLASDICRALVTSRGERAAGIQLDTAFDQTRAGVDYAVPFAFLMGESLLQTLDALAHEPSASIRLALTSDDGGGISFTISTPSLTEAHVAPQVAHRIIEGFARQIGATVEYTLHGAFVTRVNLHRNDIELAAE